MTILDTNVVSEPLRPRPSREVAEWLAGQNSDELFITTVTQAEMLAGIEGIPHGARRKKLASVVQHVLLLFAGRILPFDEDAASAFPTIVSGRIKLGRPVSNFDALIASIARSRGAALATRDTGGFEHCGIRVVNPWTR